jgi:hypothetical protein
MKKTNKVVRVNYAGGILGLIGGNARGKLEQIIHHHNADGWNVAEVVTDNPNLVIWFLRALLLMVTLGLWTIGSSRLVIFERPVA